MPLRPRLALVPPTSALERTLVDIWADILGRDDISTDDNFFDLGAGSLQAAEVLNRVEARLGCRLPLGAVAEQPTVQGMARSIAAAATGKAPLANLVTLARSDARRSMFCVHGMGGHVLVFAPLARRLAPWMSFHAFESVGRADFDRRDQTVEAMAARYVEAARRLQPAGPYVLGGYSMGGVIALEMAHQLIAAGETVELVALLDTDLHELAVPVRDRAIEFVSKALGVDPPVCLPYERLAEAARLIRGNLEARHGRAIGLTEADIVRFTDIYLANEAALRDYAVPADYAGTATLFYSTGGPHTEVTDPEEAARRLGWDGVLAPGRLRVVPVRGDHWTMFSEHADTLAAAVVSQLDVTRHAR